MRIRRDAPARITPAIMCVYSTWYPWGPRIYAPQKRSSPFFLLNSGCCFSPELRLRELIVLFVFLFFEFLLREPSCCRLQFCFSIVSRMFLIFFIFLFSGLVRGNVRFNYFESFIRKHITILRTFQLLLKFLNNNKWCIFSLSLIPT